MLLTIGLATYSVLAFSIKYKVCHGTLERYASVGLQGSTFNWKIENLKGVSFSSAIKVYYRNGDSIDVRWDVPLDTFILKVQEITQYNCNSLYVNDTIIIGGDYFKFPTDSFFICESSSDTLKAPARFLNYKWNGLVGDSLKIVSQLGKYVVEAEAKDGCIHYDSIWVNIKKNPDLDIGVDRIRLCGEYDNKITLKVPSHYNNITWSTGETSRSLFINLSESSKVITVKATDTSGCFGNDTIILEKCETDLFAERLPTAFTPNDDGKNDTWEIPELKDFDVDRKCSVEVYDRWGRLVYKSERGYPKPWNGRTTDGRKLPVDAYFFIIDFKNGSDPITGSITLLR